MKITAIIFDCLGVIYTGKTDTELLEFIKQLKIEYKTGMITSSSRSFIEQVFASHDIDEYFDEVILSAETGVYKPEPEIYRRIAEALGVDTNECVMIDDLEENIRGAEAVGMKGVLYENIEQLHKELEKILKS